MNLNQSFLLPNHFNAVLFKVHQSFFTGIQDTGSLIPSATYIICHVRFLTNRVTPFYRNTSTFNNTKLIKNWIEEIKNKKYFLPVSFS